MFYLAYKPHFTDGNKILNDLILISTISDTHIQNDTCYNWTSRHMLFLFFLLFNVIYSWTLFPKSFPHMAYLFVVLCLLVTEWMIRNVLLKIFQKQDNWAERNWINRNKKPNIIIIDSDNLNSFFLVIASILN